MGFMDTLSGAGRGVSEKARNVSEVNNLKRKILYEEERIVEVFADIGKKYYKNPDEDPAVLKVLCEDIDTRRRRIKKMRFELNSIRGYKICPKCDAEVNEKFQFCGVSVQSAGGFHHRAGARRERRVCDMRRFAGCGRRQGAF